MDAHSPPETNDGNELLEDDWEDDTAARAAAGRQPNRKCAAVSEPVAQNGDGGVEPGVGL